MVLFGVMAAASVVHFPAMAEESGPVDGRITELDDLDGKRIGVMVGTILDAAIEKHLDYLQLEYYDDHQDMEEALKDGRLNAVMGDLVVLRHIALHDPKLRVLEESVSNDIYGFGFRYEDKEAYGRFNIALGRFMVQGDVDRLVAKWVDGPAGEKTMPAAEEYEASEGDLVLGTCPASPPFTYKDDEGRIVGLDIELAGMIAREMNRRLVIVDMEFGELIPSLLGKRVDVIGACISITSDRMKNVYFTDGYFRTGVGAMVRDE